MTETSPAEQIIDLKSPELYLNRELTWLEFNKRVLHEGQDNRTPLLERLKFLAIVSSNLDEFFMKRIGGLMQQIGAGVQERSVDGRTPVEQVDACHDVVRELKAAQSDLFDHLLKALKKEGIVLTNYAGLDGKGKDQLRTYFLDQVFPLVTPQAIDPAHPFPFISNLSLNLLVTVRDTGTDKQTLVRIKVPSGAGIGLPRFIRVGDEHTYVTMEELIANNLDLLLPGLLVETVEFFRVTRNAITDQNEDSANDLLELIESELRDRKFAPIVRLEISAGMEPLHSGKLAAELGLNEEIDVFESDVVLAKRDLFEICAIDRPDLHDAPHHPLDHPDLADSPNMFHTIREKGALLVHHPYESFVTSVERFLKEASTDPKVVAIKTTLYRTAKDSKIIEYLVNAAQNGKQVAVVVELKARFDESSNIAWANYLEEKGIHVTYGIIGLKTHSKVIFVVRRDYDGLRRYLHLGTGNYHAGTARLYSDLGLFTCDETLGNDLTELFNYLTTGLARKRSYKKLLPAPNVLKPALLDKIKREIDKHSEASPGLIQFKVNALEDKDICLALYEAAQAGVRIDLIVRDTCRIRPGIKGISENMRVVSVVGRFLEHTRIYYFFNQGEDEYFMGSADTMKRNLEDRVETVFPVEAPELREKIRELIDLQLNDPRSAWDMNPDGSYTQRRAKFVRNNQSSQERLIALTQKRDEKRRKSNRPKVRRSR